MKPAITIIFMFLLVGPQFLNASPVPQDSYEKTSVVFHAQPDNYENTGATYGRPDIYDNTGTIYNGGDPYQQNIAYQVGPQG